MSSELETFVVPNFLDEIKLTRNQLAFYVKEDTESTTFTRKDEESKLMSYGIVINSFYELEQKQSSKYIGEVDFRC